MKTGIILDSTGRQSTRGGASAEGPGRPVDGGVSPAPGPMVSRMAVTHPQIVTEAESLPPEGAFVPTMGALHEGHLSLVRLAVSTGRPVVVSIFVNPTQFGPGEDFDRYPRRLEDDAAAVTEAGATIVYAPDREAVYPNDEEIVAPPLPEVATTPRLEDACRPGHLEGVCQVVARLFDLVRPAVAVFGEKDYQQLLTIEAMVEADRNRWGDLAIVGAPTVRERDGLARSSRNEYLDPADRRRARGLFCALQCAHAAQHPASAEAIMMETLERHELRVDYAVIRDAETLLSVSDFTRPTRGLIAAHLGNVRLIDNMSMTVWR